MMKKIAKKKIDSLYVHIPFCVSKCNYCDFISYSLKDSLPLAEDYGTLLIKELALYDKEIDFSALKTLYIGGGTPTVYPDLRQLIYYLPKVNGEFSVEVNPGTISYDMLKDLHSLGVNRLSIGVQSFDDAMLKRMGRIHRVKDAIDGIFLAREAGFENISIDLMFGLPDQSLKDWEDQLKQAIALKVPHISAYALTLAEGTVWAEMVKNKELNIDDDLGADMLLLARQNLQQAGYKQYEISNFALPGYECRHNINYWQRSDYLGIGINASSCINDFRFTNLQGDAYVHAITEGSKPIGFSEQLSIREIISEFIFLILRTSHGLDIQEFKNHFAVDVGEMFGSEINKLKALGLICEQNGVLLLTEKALPVANQVFYRFV